MSPKATRPPIEIADNTVAPGRRRRFELPIARLMSGTPVALPVVVLHGREDGPTVWLSGAVHGDELCGVEIIRLVLEALEPSAMSGTVIAVPVVNVHGFNTGQRYLPDRRDLNRSFPGSPRGSLAARIAHLLLTEVVGRCSAGIDLHTGSDHRTNLPQIRADLDDAETLRLAEAFGAPVSIHSRTRDGSLRQAATEVGATVLLYEGGEALRFDPTAIAAGRDGTMRVLAELGMILGQADQLGDRFRVASRQRTQLAVDGRCDGREVTRAAGCGPRAAASCISTWNWVTRSRPAPRSPRSSTRSESGSAASPHGATGSSLATPSIRS